MSDVVGTSEYNKPFNVLEIPNGCNNAQEQEVNDLYEFLKLEQTKYVQYKIIHDALEECINDNNDLNQTLKTKIADIMLSASVMQSLSLDESTSDDSAASLFGVSNVNQQQLNYIESNQLQDVLKSKLDNKYKEICRHFHNVTNQDINKAFDNQVSSPVQMSAEDKVLIEFKNKLMLEQEQYVTNLLNLVELLNEIASLRLEKLPQVTEQKIKECQIEERINHLKSLLTQQKVRVNIFTETSTSLKAYRELINDIKEQQKDCEKEIEELKKLKEKYNQVSCKQYDDILKSYLQYKATIQKKKLLSECIKS